MYVPTYACVCGQRELLKRNTFIRLEQIVYKFRSHKEIRHVLVYTSLNTEAGQEFRCKLFLKLTWFHVTDFERLFYASKRRTEYVICMSKTGSNVRKSIKARF